MIHFESQTIVLARFAMILHHCCPEEVKSHIKEFKKVYFLHKGKFVKERKNADEIFNFDIRNLNFERGKIASSRLAQSIVRLPWEA